MKVIKRDGHMVDYCPDKIEEAMRNEAIENIETVVKNAGLKLDN